MMKSMFQYISAQFSYQKTGKRKKMLMIEQWPEFMQGSKSMHWRIQNFKLLNTRMAMKVSGCCWYFGTKLVICTKSIKVLLVGSQDYLKIKVCCAASRISVLNKVSALNIVLRSVGLTICRINSQLLFHFNMLRLILGMIDCQLLLSFLPLFGQATNAINDEFFQ